MRLMSAVHPTTNQKRVLAKIAASPTPSVAAEQISKDANIVAARNMLMKLGMITFANGEASMTQLGMQIATEEGIIDQAGQLSDIGQKLAYTNTRDQVDSEQSGGQAAPPAQPPMPSQTPMPEGALLKQMLR